RGRTIHRRCVERRNLGGTRQPFLGTELPRGRRNHLDLAAAPRIRPCRTRGRKRLHLHDPSAHLMLLVLPNADQEGDLVYRDGTLLEGSPIQTAAYLSLFTDAPARE